MSIRSLSCLALSAGVASSSFAQLQPVALSASHAGTTGLSAIANPPSFLSGSNFTNFSRMSRTPSNGRWSVVATVDSGNTATDQVLLVGLGASPLVIAQEGVTSYENGNEFITFGINFPVLNDAGDWALTFTNTSVNAARVVRFSAASNSIDVIARTDDPAPALGESVFWGTSFVYPSISAGGDVSFVSVATFFNVGDQPEVAVQDGTTAVGRTGVTLLTGQTPASADADRVLADFDGFSTSAAGYAAWGNLSTAAPYNNTTDVVAFVNGAVVAQEGAILPGFATPVSSVSTCTMTANGDWYVIGATSDSISFVLLNGVEIAREGGPVTPGATEIWESFSDLAIDPEGNWVLSGNTNAASNDDIAVYNGEAVLAREGDGLDNTGDGTADLFISRPVDRHALPGDGFYYFASQMRDAAGANATTNYSLFRVALPPDACPADFNGDTTPGDIFDLFDFLAALDGGLDFNGDTTPADIFDLFDFLAVLDAGCP